MLLVCKLLCFPFALDVDADLLVGILADLRASEVAACLLQVRRGVPPCSLVSHLALLAPRREARCWSSAPWSGITALALFSVIPWIFGGRNCAFAEPGISVGRICSWVPSGFLLYFILWGKAPLPRRFRSLASRFYLPASALLCHCNVYLSFS